MTRNEKLDEFLKEIGVELLPFQKEILKQIINGNKIYICYPPNIRQTNTLRLMRAWLITKSIFSNGFEEKNLK